MRISERSQRPIRFVLTAYNKKGIPQYCCDSFDEGEITKLREHLSEKEPQHYFSIKEYD